ANRFALVHELRGAPEWTLDALLEKLSAVDLVLVEGFKTQTHPKLEVFRSALGKSLLHPADENIVAIASDAPLTANVPVVGVDDYAVRHADSGATEETKLAVVDRLTAGRATLREIRRGEAIRIFTGAPMPQDADTVFMQEDVRRNGGAVVVPAGLKPGANRR